MSIVALSKVTLYGPAAERDAVLDGLQRLGCVHLTNLRNSEATAGVDTRASYPDAHQALQYLLDSPNRLHPSRTDGKVDVEALIKEVLEVRDGSRALIEERAQLRKWIADVGPWGNFELPDWAREGDLRFWFYMVPHHQMARLKAIDLPWRVVSRDHRFAYVVVVAAEQPADMPVPVVPLEPRSVAKMRQRLNDVESELDALEYRRAGLTRHRDMLLGKLDEEDDRAARAKAASLALEQDQLFAVQGWAPNERVPALRRFASAQKLALTMASPGPKDSPPTLLRVSVPPKRQEEMLALIHRLVQRDYPFADKAEAHRFFTRLTGLFKNLNYTSQKAPEYQQYLAQIDELVRTLGRPGPKPSVAPSAEARSVSA
jgi:V/A-type H+-transporting ATPase subunit I